MMNNIHKILIANRGEIAVRIIKAIHDTGRKAVAIYHKADEDSLHVQMADEAWMLEGTTISDTYLSVKQIINIAENAHADAIHPGYGFLSENDIFADEVTKAGMVFIGPDAETIKKMGNKIEARKIAESLNIPLLKGRTGSKEELSAFALEMDLPILVKAAAGGGGKGMRIIRNKQEVKEVLEGTSREALSYFGNGDIYIETYLENPHHIEIQLFGDHHGNVVSLFERDCSVQRRHQKIIEEAPASVISDEIREKLSMAAIQLARHINYKNAGTVEFLYQDNKFWFLEMNTRIQVEHPVTEMVTGIDLVQEQISVAEGRPLSFSQDEVKVLGHAIEARIYAEDPATDFLPSPGDIIFHKAPESNFSRVDTALDASGKISPEFDPMISKLIVHGKDRMDAIRKLTASLEKYKIVGIKSNIDFLRGIMKHQSFVEKSPDISFCKKHTNEILKKENAQDDEISCPWLLIAFYHFIANYHSAKNSSSLYGRIGSWRINRNHVLLFNSTKVKFKINFDVDKEFEFTLNGKTYYAKLIYCDDEKCSLSLNNVITGTNYFRMKDKFILLFETKSIEVKNPFFTTARSLQVDNASDVNGSELVQAPMAGKIIDILVENNQAVKKGETLVILESMKMENKILASSDGKILQINHKSGDVVPGQETIMVLSNQN